MLCLIAKHGHQFTCECLKDYLKICNVRNKFMPAYHPHTNSQVERFNWIYCPPFALKYQAIPLWYHFWLLTVIWQRLPSFISPLYQRSSEQLRWLDWHGSLCSQKPLIKRRSLLVYWNRYDCQMTVSDRILTYYSLRETLVYEKRRSETVDSRVNRASTDCV